MGPFAVVMRRIPLLFLLPLVLAGCQATYLEQATEARAGGEYTLAADFYTRAAAQAGCPQRSQYLLLRAEVQELDGVGASALESIDKAVANCPDHVESYWMRAQRSAEAGDRDQAMADAAMIQEVHPEAAALYAELAMAAQVEQTIRTRSRELVMSLKDVLDLEAKDVKLRDTDTATLARQVPVPVTLRYQVRHAVDRPVRFEMEWEEMRSYRGDAAVEGYVFVRGLDLPTLNRGLPLFYRLSLSNQRLPMRFVVNPRGEVVDATWLREGPDRGMRPEMLRPEVAGMLKRRRVFDPGEDGRRSPGDVWRGEDVRIVDGKPVAVEYESRAIGWVETLGVRTLHIRSKTSGERYSADEQSWLHPTTAVPVRWQRKETYEVESSQGYDTWVSHLQGALISVSGVD
jgi:hypothetical protein